MRAAYAPEPRKSKALETIDSGASCSCYFCCHGSRNIVGILDEIEIMNLDNGFGDKPEGSRYLVRCARCPQPNRRVDWRRHPLRFTTMLSLMSSMAWTLLFGALIGVSLAASVPFDNCLPDSYKTNIPVPLQWVPLYVDASFSQDPKHTLRVTMWGNVTGSFTNVSLPPPSSPDWADPTKLDGKILDEPDPNGPNPKLTTLHSKIEMLTYEPWSDNTNFCATSLKNGSCPLAPVFGNSSLVPYGLPSVTLQNDFFSSYAFTSFTATFLIIYGDSKGTNIGCVSAAVTPDLGNLAWMIKFLPLIVLLFVGGATVFAGTLSPMGTLDIFHWTSNYGRDTDLLRLVTPGFGDCLQYIQFVALTGALTLNYPGFYQPIVSQASWSVLMFNQSFVSKDPGYINIRDGIYVTQGNYGLQRFAQLVGMGKVEDIWAGSMVWLLGIIGGMFVLVQGGFLAQFIYRAINRESEEDLRAKNIPFTLGNVVRIVLNYFLLPIVALSTFQLVVASESPAYTVALAVVTLIFIIIFAAWLLYLIATTKPRAFLFDDLPTVLLYGPLYNTYSDEAAGFALIPVTLTFLRGIAAGVVQPAGIAQIVILAICEVVQILTLHAFRPFHSPTSMNAYHTLFSVLRLITVLLMVAFIPSLGVTEGPKGWIGYAILLTHAGVLVLGFFLNAVQTIVEVGARLAGAGGDDAIGLSRGGLSKIFGMRQLSRRMSRRGEGPSRQSQLSNSAMLDVEEASKAGYEMPGGRLRSESAGSMGILMQGRGRSPSAPDNLSLDPHARNIDGASSFTPTTPGEASTYSFLPSPGIQVRPQGGGLGIQATSNSYYRPPRQRGLTLDNAPSPASRTRASWIGGDKRSSLVSVSVNPLNQPHEMDGQPLRIDTPGPYVQPALLTPRTDYSTREVDLYYNVRAERLNSDVPTRKLGTGPADPTGPMASAAGWLRGIFGGKSKDKGKGFEVVRSARMPPGMRTAGADFEDEAPPQGIPVAMGVLRNGPIESDDEDDAPRARSVRPAEAGPRNDGRVPGDDDLDESGAARLPEVRLIPSNDDADTAADSFVSASPNRSRHGPRTDEFGWSSVPTVPRKSSKRTPDHSRNPSVDVRLSQASSSLPLSATASSRLPFERTPSQKRLSGSSAAVTDELGQSSDIRETLSRGEERPTTYGFVHQGSINRVDHDTDLLGTSAEVIDKRR